MPEKRCGHMKGFSLVPTGLHEAVWHRVLLLHPSAIRLSATVVFPTWQTVVRTELL